MPNCDTNLASIMFTTVSKCRSLKGMNFYGSNLSPSSLATNVAFGDLLPGSVPLEVWGSAPNEDFIPITNLCCIQSVRHGTSLPLRNSAANPSCSFTLWDGSKVASNTRTRSPPRPIVYKCTSLRYLTARGPRGHGHCWTLSLSTAIPINESVIDWARLHLYPIAGFWSSESTPAIRQITDSPARFGPTRGRNIWHVGRLGRWHPGVNVRGWKSHNV